MCELWVRSQNKKILEKVDTIIYSNVNAEREYNEHEYNYRVGHFVQSSMNTLGEYKSEERANEIINEIQELLKGADICLFHNCDITAEQWHQMKKEKVGIVWDVGKDNKSSVEFISSNIVVYEMPLE